MCQHSNLWSIMKTRAACSEWWHWHQWLVWPGPQWAHVVIRAKHSSDNADQYGEYFMAHDTYFSINIHASLLLPICFQYVCLYFRFINVAKTPPWKIIFSRIPHYFFPLTWHLNIILSVIKQTPEVGNILIKSDFSQSGPGPGAGPIMVKF